MVSLRIINYNLRILVKKIHFKLSFNKFLILLKKFQNIDGCDFASKIVKKTPPYPSSFYYLFLNSKRGYRK